MPENPRLQERRIADGRHPPHQQRARLDRRDLSKAPITPIARLPGIRRPRPVKSLKIPAVGRKIGRQGIHPRMDSTKIPHCTSSARGSWEFHLKDALPMSSNNRHRLKSTTSRTGDDVYVRNAESARLQRFPSSPATRRGLPRGDRGRPSSTPFRLLARPGVGAIVRLYAAKGADWQRPVPTAQQRVTVTVSPLPARRSWRAPARSL